ncbi:crotonase/enoyl-CoA hydratase family protein [Thalassotalea castellviae]|uniref:Crotonase/enoyl-CoA hydratase family protein n=1 Tax=Thalassotalea castellviae TaxID=3075612 RepID=A0ABU3A548_9GAMM|nr:crotonase/enoyl-CoA hydratase family protein [Thalassotalea sp. W431]MDT0605304.1 crotonase/enoyl-CoA hydratase family protein [Thalassotalea sp. W431]
MNYINIDFQVNNNIAFVTLSRPEKHNAIDMTTFNELNHVIKRIDKDTSIRAVIVSGKGEDFCSGIDVKSLFKSPQKAIRLLLKCLPGHSNNAQKVSTGWRKLAVPVIFAIQGRCWGAGMQIAFGGDFRIATPDASMSIMEAKWGLIPDMGGTLALRELVRLDIAKELAMTAKIISGEEALNLGLLTKVSPDPLQAATKLANDISQFSPDSVSACKKLYNKSWWGSARSALARETLYQIKVLFGKNYKIKSYNQTHDKTKQKPFKARMKW